MVLLSPFACRLWPGEPPAARMGTKRLCRVPWRARPQSLIPLPPTLTPLVLEREVGNYAELDRLLKAVPGPALLFEEGPLDGPVRGFGTMAKVPAAGLYTVTVACVGGSGAVVSVGQEHPGAPFQPVALCLKCAGATSRVLPLEQGYVFAHLVLPVPGDTPWTGAVGGVRVTGPGASSLGPSPDSLLDSSKIESPREN